MRLFQLSAIAALALSLVGPALAQEAGDCDMLCRLRGYLSSDHMATRPSEEAPARAPAKPHHLRAAAHKPTPSAKHVAVAAAPGAPASASPPAPRAVVATPPVAKLQREAAKPAGQVAPVAPVPMRVARAAQAERAVPAPAAPKALTLAKSAAVPKTSAAPERVAESRPRAPQPAPPPRATAVAKPTRTASLSTTIPGSAPAVPAGFH